AEGADPRPGDGAAPEGVDHDEQHDHRRDRARRHERVPARGAHRARAGRTGGGRDHDRRVPRDARAGPTGQRDGATVLPRRAPPPRRRDDRAGAAGMPAGPESTEPGTDVHMDRLVGWILITGVVGSVVLIASGMLWHCATHGTLMLDYELPA